MAELLACAKDSPLVATGDPIEFGLMNMQGDPAASYPEYTASAQSAVDFINKELGGVGADFATKTPGRPIKLDTCFMKLNPADAVSCANELAAKKPFLVMQGLDFFPQSVYPVMLQAGILSIAGVPISVADYQGEHLYSFGAGGGTPGTLPAMVEFAVNTLLKGNTAPKIALPWADTPPGVASVKDLLEKPMNVLSGTVQSSASVYGSTPGLTYQKFPIAPGSADVTAQATAILAMKPDVILYSANAPDCFNLLETLTRLGWTPEQIPLVTSGSCLDRTKLDDAGDKAAGMYFVGGNSNTEPDLYTGLLQVESQTFLDKNKEYAPGQDLGSFSGPAFNTMMTVYDVLNEAASKEGADKVTPAAFEALLAATSNRHAFGEAPIGCADAVKPYKSVCSTKVSATEWNGEGFDIARPDFDGTYIIADTDLITGS